MLMIRAIIKILGGGPTTFLYIFVHVHLAKI